MGQRGYAAIVLMLIVTLASVAAVMDRLDSRQLRMRRARDAAAAMQLARTALLGYAATYRDLHPAESFGRLPCPDATGSGIEQTPCGKAGKIAIGLLPYRTLGLPELRDASGSCLWYAVSGSFKSNPKASPFNWDSRGEITVLDAGGTPLAAPDDDGGGAAAVVVAPGPVLAGQRRLAGAGSCAVDPAQLPAYLENRAAVFTHGDASDRTGTNDRVTWIASKDIFDLVVERSDFASYLSRGIEAVRAQMGSQREAAGSALPADNPFGRQAADHSFYDDWRDQFRYLRCARPGCYADGAGNPHDAVLIFSGRGAADRPRPATARALPDYFESALKLARREEFKPCDPNPAAFDNTSPSARMADIVLCLSP